MDINRTIAFTKRLYVKELRFLNAKERYVIDHHKNDCDIDISGKYEEYYELDKYTKQINNTIKI